jgi:hypothetical protein
MRGDTGGSSSDFFYISLFFLCEGIQEVQEAISFVFLLYFFFLCEGIQEVQEAISRALGREKEDVEVFIRPEKAAQRKPSPQSSSTIGTKGAEGAAKTHTAAAVSSHTGMYVCVCMYVCMYVYIYVCIYIYIYIIYTLYICIIGYSGDPRWLHYCFTTALLLLYYCSGSARDLRKPTGLLRPDCPLYPAGINTKKNAS